jgi:hypothetical protein
MRYSAPLMSELGLVSRESPVQIRSVSACKIDIAARPSSGTHQNHCRSAHPMSVMGHKPRRRLGPGASLCPQYLQSRRNFVHRSERRQVPIASECIAANSDFL